MNLLVFYDFINIFCYLADREYRKIHTNFQGQGNPHVEQDDLLT